MEASPGQHCKWLVKGTLLSPTFQRATRRQLASQQTPCVIMKHDVFLGNLQYQQESSFDLQADCCCQKGWIREAARFLAVQVAYSSDVGVRRFKGFILKWMDAWKERSLTPLTDPNQ
eukprot:424606-Amphidinium_carterae.1